MLPIRFPVFGAAVLACMSFAAQAQSSVTIWGVVDAYAGRQQLAGQQSRTAMGSGGLTTSRVAFLGSEDLGGGLRANFNLQHFMRVNTGEPGRFPGDVFWAGRSTVGLSGGFGEVNLGRMNSPMFFALMRFDVFELAAIAPVFQHSFPGGQPIQAPQQVSDSAMNHSVQYGTPDLGGWRAAVHYGLSNTASNRRRLGLNLSYANGPFAAAVASDDIEAPLPQGETKQTARMGALSWDFGVVKLVGIAMRHEQKTLGNVYKTYNLGASIPVAKLHKVLVSYAHTDLGTLAGERKRRTLTLAYDHVLSKRTDLYLLGSLDKSTGLNNGRTLVAGIRHRF